MSIVPKTLPTTAPIMHPVEQPSKTIIIYPFIKILPESSVAGGKVPFGKVTFSKGSNVTLNSGTIGNLAVVSSFIVAIFSVVLAASVATTVTVAASVSFRASVTSLSVTLNVTVTASVTFKVTSSGVPVVVFSLSSAKKRAVVAP